MTINYHLILLNKLTDDVLFLKKKKKILRQKPTLWLNRKHEIKDKKALDNSSHATQFNLKTVLKSFKLKFVTKEKDFWSNIVLSHNFFIEKWQTNEQVYEYKFWYSLIYKTYTNFPKNLYFYLVKPSYGFQ